MILHSLVRPNYGYEALPSEASWSVMVGSIVATAGT